MDQPAIVMDNGTHLTRAGFGGELEPKIVFRTVVSRPANWNKSQSSSTVYIGPEIGSIGDKKVASQLHTWRHPMEFGAICNWDDMELLWSYTFSKGLGVDPTQHPILVSESVPQIRSCREKILQIMFENFEVPAFYMAAQPVLALLASGRQTGLVLDAGDQESRSVPVYQGHALLYPLRRRPNGGRDLTYQLMPWFKKMGYYTSYRDSVEVLRDLKENLCYVAPNNCVVADCSPSQSISLRKSYTLPDGREIFLNGYDRVRGLESLFNVEFQNTDDVWLPVIPQAIHDTIRRCQQDIQKNLYENIVMCGGNTLFPGFAERLQKELTMLTSNDPEIELNVIAPQDRQNSVWTGGSILAAQANFRDMWISKDEYNEFGPTFVHRKCF